MLFIWSVIFSWSVVFADSSCELYGEMGVSEQTHQVSSYKSDFRFCSYNGKEVFSLRNFQLDQVNTQLVVDPQSLKTSLLRSSCLKGCQALTQESYEASYYGEVQGRSLQAPFPTHNDGLLKGISGDSLVALTIDMCPTKKGISQKVYDRLLQIAKKEGRAFPVGIAMTQKWMNSYPKQFQWLKKQQLMGRLEILWINHSATHPYKAGVPLEKNFLLSAGVNFTQEVLGTEVSLIKGGVTPSLFFRFPGLVSSESLIRKLGDWGLIPLGSNAWLAKGQKPKADSIILIHGNQNEPAGEVAFLNYVETKSADIAWASLLNLLGI